MYGGWLYYNVISQNVWGMALLQRHIPECMGMALLQRHIPECMGDGFITTSYPRMYGGWLYYNVISQNVWGMALLQRHIPECMGDGFITTSYPRMYGGWLYYNVISQNVWGITIFKIMKAPIVIYADFECFVKKMEKIQEHIVCGYSYVVVVNHASTFSMRFKMKKLKSIKYLTTPKIL